MNSELNTSPCLPQHKKYLTEAQGIAGKRIKIEQRNLPVKPSKALKKATKKTDASKFPRMTVK